MAKWFVISIFCFGLSVAADESTMSLPGAEIGPLEPTNQLAAPQRSFFENYKFEDYKGITDLAMVASEGSLSRWSLKFSLSLTGPEINDLGSKYTPNPDHVNRPTDTALSGNFGLRTRLDSQTAINFGTGAKAIHPITGIERYDLSTPFASYDHVSRIDDFQMSQSLSLSRATLPNYTMVGMEGSAGYDVSTVHDIGNTRWAWGLSSGIGYSFYNRKYSPVYSNLPPVETNGNGHGHGHKPPPNSDLTIDAQNGGYVGELAQNNGAISFSPELKCQLGNRSQVSTSLRESWTSPRDNVHKWSNLQPETLSQMVGVGYSYTRDIYFFPNIRFYPGKLATDLTTVNVSTVFSIF